MLDANQSVVGQGRITPTFQNFQRYDVDDIRFKFVLLPSLGPPSRPVHLGSAAHGY